MKAIVLLVAIAAAAADIQFQADVSSAGVPFVPLLQRCFGSGHAELTLRQDWRQQLIAVKRDINPEFVRFHGLLDDDMSVVFGVGTYGFANVFNIFDFLVSIKMRPIVELSFMPEALASNPAATIFHYKGGISPPKSYDDWAHLISTLVDGLVTRYGLEEVQQWKFEVWNEPNCGFFSGTQQEYFTLYNYTSRAVKSVSPTLKVGGPATCQLAWFPEFFGNATAMGAPVDMITSHLYPTDPMVAQNRSGFVDYVSKHAALAASFGVPLVMTEFNSGLGISEGQDGPFAASFIASTALAVQSVPNLDVLSFWTFSDVFEEGGFASVPYHAGYGMQTYNAIPKLVYRSFQLVNSLLSTAVLLQTSGTVDIAVTVDKSSVVILLVNYNWLSQPIAAESVTVALKGLKCTPTAVVLTTLDESTSNSKAAWEAMGSPTYLNATQIASLTAASQFAPVNAQFSTDGKGGLTFSATLQPYSVSQAVLQGC